MNFLKAIHALESGKLIRRKCWKHENAYWFGSGDHIIGINGEPAFVNYIPQLTTDDWELLKDDRGRAVVQSFTKNAPECNLSTQTGAKHMSNSKLTTDQKLEAAKEAVETAGHAEAAVLNTTLAGADASSGDLVGAEKAAEAAAEEAKKVAEAVGVDQVGGVVKEATEKVQDTAEKAENVVKSATDTLKKIF